MKQAASPIRFVLIALIALAFGAVSIASAQHTSINSNQGNRAYETIGSRGVTIDRVEFTIPQEFVTQPGGVYRPNALVQINVPVTNTRSRDMVCEIVYHHLDSAVAIRARRIATWENASSGVLVPAGSTVNLFYAFRFNDANTWLPEDWNAEARWDVKVICDGVAPSGQPVTTH